MIGSGSKAMDGLSSLSRHRSSSSSGVESPPEPNVAAPPPSQLQQKHFIIPPWTPWTPNLEQIPPTSYIGNEEKNHSRDETGMIDDESLPSIPDVPSPYSPPPASLFSPGEKFPSKSIRRQKQPYDDYRTQHSMNFQENQHHNSNYNNSIPSDEKHHMNTSQYNRQQLLPTVLYLKKDLEESHATMHLLQQENKALASECDKFQNEIKSFTEQHQEIVSIKDRQIEQLQEQLQLTQRESNESHKCLEKERTGTSTVKGEMERLAKQLEVSVVTNQRLDVTNSDLKQEVEATSAEIKSLRATMKEHSQVSSQKMKEAVTSNESKIQKLKEECQSLTIETDRLKAMHHEAVQYSTKEVATAKESFRAELAMIRAELADANQTIDDLHRGKTNLDGESLKRIDELKTLNAQLQSLRSSDSNHREEALDLKSSLADATEREEALLSDIESKQTRASESRRKMEDEIDRLTKVVEATAAEKEAQRTSLSRELEASYDKYNELRSEKDVLQRELVIMKSHKQKYSPTSVVIVERNNELESEVDNLKTALAKMTSKCHELRAEKSILSKKLLKAKKDIADTPRDDSTKQAKVFTFDENSNDGFKNDEELIPNRLERIRDAADRAALAKEHRRDLSRLKIDHEKEMKQLSERHEQDIKDVFEEAKAEVTARSRELRRHLQGDYETKIVALERRYQSDLSRMQREFDKNTAVAEEAMQAAASEVSAVTEQLNKEVAVRETLQSTNRDLEHKLVAEQQKNKLSSEFVVSRKQWQRDTNNVIAAIQQECNTVFSQNLIRNRTESPRSVTIVNSTNINDDKENSNLDDNDEKSNAMQLDESYLSRIEQGAVSTSMMDVAFPVHRTPWKRDRVMQKPTTSYNSPLDVSQALDETEALVRSLIAK